MKQCNCDWATGECQGPLECQEIESLRAQLATAAEEIALLQARSDLAVQNRNYWQEEAERRGAQLASARLAAQSAAPVGEPVGIEAAYEKHAKKIFGANNPKTLDSITHFYAGWTAARAAPTPSPPQAFRDSHPLVTALIREVDRAVSQAVREGGRYETTVRHILNEHLSAAPAPFAPQVREALEGWLAFAEEELGEFEAEDCSSEKLCPKCESSGCIWLKIVNTREALAALSVKPGEQP